MFRSLLPLVLACALFSSCGPKKSSKPLNKFNNPEIVRIATLTDERKGQALLEYFGSADPLLREEAVMAFASIQDTSLAGKLYPVLKDPDPNVRAAAAYALGQMAYKPGIADLLTMAVQERDDLARVNVLEAIGKICRADIADGRDEMIAAEAGLDFLEKMQFDTESDRLGWSKAVFWINMSGFSDEALMNRLSFMLQKSEPGSRLAAAATMARFKGDWYKQDKNQDYVLKWCRMERNSEVRVFQMAMLANVDNEDARNLLLGYLKSDSQEQAVKIAALRAAARMASVTASDLVPSLSDPDDAVALECLHSLESKEVLPEIDRIVQTSTRNAAMKSGAMRLQALAGGMDIGVLIWSSFSQATTPYDKAFYARALGSTSTHRQECFKALMEEKEYAVKYALTESFMEMNSKGADAKKAASEYVDYVLQAFQQGDIGLQALFASDLRNKQMTDDDKNRVIAVFEPALSKLVLPREIETYNEIVMTLNSIRNDKTDTALEIKKVDFNHPIDWKEIAKIPSGQQAKITTSKGEFVIDLDVNAAPSSVLSFVTLARSGFYDGKYFHRVIPNFVIQGGCPRGDGMGGTDYTLRSEFRLHDYKPGAIGLASSGRDTESCQWFINHIYTPHLEGSYTIFGYVSTGMETVKKIMVGDQIVKVEILP